MALQSALYCTKRCVQNVLDKFSKTDIGPNQENGSWVWCLSMISYVLYDGHLWGSCFELQLVSEFCRVDKNFLLISSFYSFFGHYPSSTYHYPPKWLYPEIALIINIFPLKLHKRNRCSLILQHKELTPVPSITPHQLRNNDALNHIKFR